MQCVHCGVDVLKSRKSKYCSDKCTNAVAYLRVKADPVRNAKFRASGRNHRRTVRAWLANYKLERGCVDCGYREHSAALQLDHEGPKSVEIGDARSSIARLQAEIEAGQCKVRCANCHSIRTWKTKQEDICL
jgi:hypothetical protein